MKLEMKVLNKEFYDENSLPYYATVGSAGLDLTITEDVILLPNMTKLCGTGLAIWIGGSFPYLGIINHVAGIIVPRSGTGHKRGLVLGNGTGIIDESYQGELMISLWNRTEFVQEIKAGERIAQLLIVPVFKVTLDVVEEFSNKTERHTSGFGSTGV